jgi:predicted metal-dependent phosphoesterase TrpH
MPRWLSTIARRSRPRTLPRLSADPPTFDLQSHSYHSDGTLAPGEVVAAAAAAGVQLLALSDHDTVDGVQDARVAAAELDVRLVPAVEISAIDEGAVDQHILGYLIDHRDPHLSERLVEYRADRGRRATAMAQALSELGFQLDEELLRRRATEGKSIGRPHLARAVMAAPANAPRLAAEGLTNPSAFLEAYLVEGRPGFRPRTSPTVPESIAAIHEAGGVAVWAHPFWTVAHPDAVLCTIDRMHAHGIDGVECFYVKHGREQTRLLVQRCDRLDLLTTGSSDFHGPDHPELSGFRAFSTYGHEPRLGPIAAPSSSR